MSLALTTPTLPPRVSLWTIFLSFSFPIPPPLCLRSLPFLRPVSLFLTCHRHHNPLPPPLHHPLRSVGLSLLFLSTTLAALVLRMLLLTHLPLPTFLLPRLHQFIISVLDLDPLLIATLLPSTASLLLLSRLPIRLP